MKVNHMQDQIDQSIQQEIKASEKRTIRLCEVGISLAILTRNVEKACYYEIIIASIKESRSDDIADALEKAAEKWKQNGLQNGLLFDLEVSQHILDQIPAPFRSI